MVRRDGDERLIDDIILADDDLADFVAGAGEDVFDLVGGDVHFFWERTWLIVWQAVTGSRSVAIPMPMIYYDCVVARMLPYACLAVPRAQDSIYLCATTPK